MTVGGKYIWISEPLLKGDVAKFKTIQKDSLR